MSISFTENVKYSLINVEQTAKAKAAAMAGGGPGGEAPASASADGQSFTSIVRT